MAQWGNNGVTSNSVLWAPVYVNKTGNTLQRDRLYANSTADAYITNETIGMYSVEAVEISGHVSNLVITSGTGLTDNIGVVISAASGVNSINAVATAKAKMVSAVLANSGTTAVPGNILSIDGTGATVTTAATVNTTATKVTTTTINGLGTGGSYVPGDLLTIDNTGGVAVVNATANVLTTQVRTVAKVAGGSGYANGDTVRTATGTATTPPVFTVTTGASDTIVASLARTGNGIFTTNPTLTAGATTNTTGSGTGLTVTVTMMVKTVGVVNAGSYTTNPTDLSTNPVTTNSATGTGANLTFTMGVDSIATKNTGSYSVVPTNLAPNAPTGSGNTGVRLTIAFGVGAVTFSNTGNGYFQVPSVTFLGTGLTGASAVVKKGGNGVQHTGWVLRRAGTGGRAGRVTYETLVAGGSYHGNTTNDSAIFPI